MRFCAILLIILCLFSCNKATDVPAKPGTVTRQSSEENYKKEMEEIKKNLKGDIKIKLKKDNKSGYSWEITGKDAQEVIKTNETLKKRLND
jgi:hypothetical protein